MGTVFLLKKENLYITFHWNECKRQIFNLHLSDKYASKNNVVTVATNNNLFLKDCSIPIF